MAGKHVGGAIYTGSLTHPAVYPGRKENKAFAEGYIGVPASNPHPSGSPANAAYTAGAASSGEEAASGVSIVRGFTFDGVDSHALTDATIAFTSSQAYRWKIQLRDDGGSGVRPVIWNGNGSFYVQIDANDNIKIKQGATIVTLTGITVTQGVDYVLQVDSDLAATISATLTPIAGGAAQADSDTALTTSVGTQAMYIGADQPLSNFFTGVIGKVEFWTGGVTTRDGAIEWGEQAGTTVADSDAAVLDSTIIAFGAWFPSGATS